jgi:3-dehydroquinate synthase
MTGGHRVRKPNIFLYGPPGVGKSGIGKRLAQDLALPFFDLDDVIEQDTGSTIPEIFAQEGEAGFRRRESRMLEQLIDPNERIIALGGGTLLRDENRRLAETNGHVILLDASLAVLQERLRQSNVDRPLLRNDADAHLSELLNHRNSHYRSFPSKLDVSHLDVEQAAWELQIILGRFRIHGMQGRAQALAYPVRVIPGGLDELGLLLGGPGLNGEAIVITDRRIAPHYASRAQHSLGQAGWMAHSIVLPEGETSKTLETAGELWRQFLEAGLDRSGVIVALGGGVITDLAGFAAALYMRGIRWVAAPTSLLGMVDASLGGKTGVNLPQGKNLVGSFYPPELVLADPDLLSTLPLEELRSGMAEVVKHGVIADPVLFDICSQGMEHVKMRLCEVVCRAMAVKVKVVTEDPFEKGLRETLNLGHTLGHALEKASQFQLRHGEAVAIGLAAIARTSVKLGYLDEAVATQICATLQSLGLPTHAPPMIDRTEIEKLMRVDKKRNAGVLRFVIPVGMGRIKRGVEIANLDTLWEVM